MGRKNENQGFICSNCGKTVLPISKGTIRNHCPFCLCSLHVDETIGDRKSNCGGIMRPVSVIYNSKKGYQIIHKCEKCGFVRANVVCDDPVQPDNMDLVIKLMNKKY